MAVLITMTSQLRHGVLVVSLQEKYSLVNSTGSPLIALTALAAQGKKVREYCGTQSLLIYSNSLISNGLVSRYKNGVRIFSK